MSKYQYPEFSPRVGGMVTYQKPGQTVARGLVEWVYPEGTCRVRNMAVGGRRTVIREDDVRRAFRKLNRASR